MNSLAHRNRTLVAWLLLCAMALRALIPQGFMPGSLASGTPLVICSGGVFKTVMVDDQGELVTEQKPNHAQNPCPFALALVASPIAAAITWQADYIADDPNPQRLALGVLPSHSPTIHLPRGPPALS